MNYFRLTDAQATAANRTIAGHRILPVKLANGTDWVLPVTILNLLPAALKTYFSQPGLDELIQRIEFRLLTKPTVAKPQP